MMMELEVYLSVPPGACCVKGEQVSSETTTDELSEEVQDIWVVNKDPQQLLQLLKATLHGRAAALLWTTDTGDEDC